MFLFPPQGQIAPSYAYFGLVNTVTIWPPQALSNRITGYLIASTPTAIGRGAMSGMQIIGDTGSGVLDVDKYVFTTNSSGVSAGFVDVPLNPTNLVSKPSKNPKITVACFCSSTNSRQYVGWSSASSIPISDTPLANTDVGVIVGFRSTDANYTVITNDGLGAPHITALPLAKDTLVHTISISLSVSSIVCSVDSNTVTINTNLPDINLNLFIEGQAV